VQGCCWQHEQQKRCKELWYLKTTLPPPPPPPIELSQQTEHVSKTHIKTGYQLWKIWQYKITTR
jgi:hypothetical protein